MSRGAKNEAREIQSPPYWSDHFRDIVIARLLEKLENSVRSAFGCSKRRKKVKGEDTTFRRNSKGTDNEESDRVKKEVFADISLETFIEPVYSCC